MECKLLVMVELYLLGRYMATANDESTHVLGVGSVDGATAKDSGVPIKIWTL